MHHTHDTAQSFKKIYWPVWLNGWAFVYELSGCRLESRFYHIAACIYNTIIVSPK